jgi:hypothetical protein
MTTTESKPSVEMTSAVPVGSGAVLDGTCPVCGKEYKIKRRGRRCKTCSRNCGKIYRATFYADQLKSMAKIIQKLAVKKTTGKHGFGRMARNNKNHINAKFYRIRSPKGCVHEVKNLTAWCRNNKQLFEPDPRAHNARLPLLVRAQVGINSVASGKKCSWHGWTAVCVFDIETDPLARRVALPPNR